MRIDRVKLVAEMARADVNVKELSARAGVSRVTITSIRGGRCCSQRTAEKLAAGLGIQLTSLLEDKGEKTP